MGILNLYARPGLSFYSVRNSIYWFAVCQDGRVFPGCCHTMEIVVYLKKCNDLIHTS